MRDLSMPVIKKYNIFRYKTCKNVYIYEKRKLYSIKENWFDKEGTKLVYLFLYLFFALLTCCNRVKKVIIYKNYSYSDVLCISNF